MKKTSAEKIILYHGSDHIIEKPVFGLGSSHNDYGRGFYCTHSLELAKEWACGKGTDGFANEYEFDISGLNVINLNNKPYNILNWLAVLTQNRTYWQSGAISAEAKEYLREYFCVDISSADVIIGYRADDSYFTFAQDFVSGAIPIEKLKKAMHLGELGEQTVIMSKKSFDRLSFKQAYPADKDEYYEKKQMRDKKARLKYREERDDRKSIDGLFMLDIMREGITNGDPRIQ